MRSVKYLFLLLVASLFLLVSCEDEIPDEPLKPTVSSVDVSQRTIKEGREYEFTAVVKGKNNPSQRVKWELITSDSEGVTFKNGSLTIPDSTTAEIFTAKAISFADTTKSGFSTVNISTVNYIVDNVIISNPAEPGNFSVGRGGALQLKATVEGPCNPPQTVNWSVMGGVSNGTVINQNGLLFVAINEAAPLLIVTATSVADPTKYKNVKITNTSFAMHVVITPPDVSVDQGGWQQFSADLVDGRRDPQDFTWQVIGRTSSNTEINPNGLLFVAINETAPLLIVTATSRADSTKTGDATVNVNVPAEIVTVTINPREITLHPGDPHTFTASVTGTDNQSVTWAISDSTYSSIGSESGLLTVGTDEPTPGTLTVTATSLADPNVSDHTNVYISEATNPPDIRVTVTSPVTSWYYGGEVTFTATVEGDSSQGVSWALSDNTSSNIEPDGLSCTLNIGADETAPSLTVTATSIADDSKSDSATIYLSALVVTGVTITTQVTDLSPDDVLQFDTTITCNFPPTPAFASGIRWEVSNNATDINTAFDNNTLTIGPDEQETTLTITAFSEYASEENDFLTVNIWRLRGDGPGGGLIFHIGLYSDTWRYLEAAPYAMETEAEWGLAGVECPDTQAGIGAGKDNTDAILDLLSNEGEAGKAAQLCDALDIGGFNDWFLPSKDELNRMYDVLCEGGNVGGFDTSSVGYWSSSADSDDDEHKTWYQDFSDGGQDAGLRDVEMKVRAVRRF